MSMGAEKSYEYMMDSLRRIIDFVKEVSVDWWWFEQGNIPVIRVRKLSINKEVSFDYLPKVPIVKALKIIYSNFELIRKLPPRNRVDYALKTAQDLYLVLQAISYIIDAHNLADKVQEAREYVARMSPEMLDKFIEVANQTIQRIREILASNVFSWPSKREEIEKEIGKVVNFARDLVSEKESERGEVPA